MFRRGRSREAVDFSNACRRALYVAREEAVTLGHAYVGTEHILLAILKASDDDVPRLIAKLGLVPSRVRRDVETQIADTTSKRFRDDELPWTSRAKKVLELAMSEACELDHRVVQVGHLLLGLIAEEKGVAAQVLRTHGVTHAAARATLARISTRRKTFSVRIDDRADRSIYEQIVAQVLEAVATSELLSGDRLPTVRDLADDLDIAPGTVARAYGELERLGVVTTDGVHGTSVAHRQERTLPDSVRPETLVGLLRPVAVAAFHLGASAPEVRQALENAMQDIFPTAPLP